MLFLEKSVMPVSIPKLCDGFPRQLIVLQSPQVIPLVFPTIETAEIATIVVGELVFSCQSGCMDFFRVVFVFTDMRHAFAAKA